MKYSYVTDKGIRRQENQDCCYAFEPEPGAVFAIVCDGMGGENAGDIASTLAVETVVHRIRTGWHRNMQPSSVKNLLLTSITAANICVFDLAESEEIYRGMGTTVVCAVILDDFVTVAHVGDSRAYIYAETLRQLTKDHSLVQELLDAGDLTPDEAKNYPKKNYITRALGVAEKIEIDFTRSQFGKGDKLLLCSDGLTNFVPDEEIKGILDEHADNAAKKLVGAANAAGGGDNITAVVISNS
ncbi:MAG: Stp1/IreP family PP2C-type Ser/Thr phosphatase [Clostridia bacterium]|nr:Stp1/IreP family PP2C-type Ser/Thr phosphatase [Clostridia bacterium]